LARASFSCPGWIAVQLGFLIGLAGPLEYDYSEFNQAGQHEFSIKYFKVFYGQTGAAWRQAQGRWATAKRRQNGGNRGKRSRDSGD
jgi:hypothetical protein